jgi:purine-nucleoside phosphorylase
MEKVREAARYIQQHVDTEITHGIILGTGLGALVDDIDIDCTINYEDIPYFPVSTVDSHNGKLIIGTVRGRRVVVMQGRFHYYEGYSAVQITFPVRVMKLLGVQKLFISNASGGLDPKHEVGDLMIITDHINLHPENPLRGPNLDDLGLRFPDMSEPYDRQMIAEAEKYATGLASTVHKGVYVSVTGPNLETPAEYRFLRIIGADAVGMSTVPETIVARHMNIPVFALSIITDLGVDGRIEPVTIEKVLEAAARAEPDMTKMFLHLISL